MSYTDLASTGVISEDYPTLNGIKTRKKPLQFDDAFGSSVTTGIGLVTYQQFSSGDILYATLVLDDRMSRDVDATLEIIGFPETSEASVEVSFDVEILSIDDVAGTLANAAATGTLQLVDQAVSGTAWTMEKFTLTVASATYFADTDVEALAFKITRIAATADLVGDYGLASIALQHQVDR